MRIYYPLDDTKNILVQGYREHEFTFTFGQHNFEFVDSIEDSDIIPITPGGDFVNQSEYIKQHVPDLKNKIILIIQTTHLADGDDLGHCYFSMSRWEQLCPNVYFVTLNYSLNTFNKIITNDFCFNRQKAYFTEYEKYDMYRRLWAGESTIACFKLNDIETIDVAKKRFLIPNNIPVHYPDQIKQPRLQARLFIKNLIDENDSYYSHPQEGILLDTEEKNPKLNHDYAKNKMGMGFLPLSNHYYETSIVSVYGETIVEGNRGVRCVSEKTFNPLIKGHFILPLSYAGIIHDLKEIYGFKFPDWIDYSYDNYVSIEKRFSAFKESLNKIRSLSLEELTELRNRDTDILKHNRSIFYTRGYDSLYQSLSKELVKAGLM